MNVGKNKTNNNENETNKIDDNKNKTDKINKIDNNNNNNNINNRDDSDGSSMCVNTEVNLDDDGAASGSEMAHVWAIQMHPPSNLFIIS
jgi:hypothetical protein